MFATIRNLFDKALHIMKGFIFYPELKILGEVNFYIQFSHILEN